MNSCRSLVRIQREREGESFFCATKALAVITCAQTAASARSVNVQLWRQVHKQIGTLQINYIIYCSILNKIKAKQCQQLCANWLALQMQPSQWRPTSKWEWFSERERERELSREHRLMFVCLLLLSLFFPQPSCCGRSHCLCLRLFGPGQVNDETGARWRCGANWNGTPESGGGAQGCRFGCG